MKRINLFLVFILLGVLLACFTTRAKAISVYTEYDPPIVLQETEPSVDPNSPRAPLIVPISCFFNSSSECLYFSFLFPMGDVTITLAEASAGIVSAEKYSTSSCFVSVPVPGIGTYSISILLESGTEYVGQFFY